MSSSGEAGALDTCEQRLKDQGAKRFVRLPVAGAFHSPVMQSAAEKLEADLAQVTFNEPQIPVISNVTAKPVTTAAAARDTLSRQVVSPVYFERSLRYMIDQGVQGFVEPGPGRASRGFVRKIDRGLQVDGFDKADDVAPSDTED